MKQSIKTLLILGGVLVLFSFIQQPKTWDVPAEYKSKPNPVKKTEKVMALGKSKYNQVCAGCHGVTGDGHGVKVKNRNIVPVNLISPEVINQTDGEHFFKIKYGRGVGTLHSFKGSLDDEEIWAIIHYTKSLAK